MKGVSIIIVNYKTPKLVVDCLKTIYQFDTSCIADIIVVDNDSKDNSKSIVQTEFPQVKWIDAGYNMGFARANNLGIKESKGDAILLLNSDTLVLQNAIHLSYQRLMSSSNAGCGVQLLNADLTPQLTGNYFMTGSLNNLLPIPYIGRVLRSIAFAINVKKTNIPEVTGQAKVDWINGAYLMVKKEVIDKVGPLDEDFFLYAEEAEWCYRISGVGPLVVYGDIHVVHLQGESALSTFGSQNKSYQFLFDRKGAQILLSNLVRIRKQHGVLWYLFHLLFYTLSILPILLCVLIESLLNIKNTGKIINLFKGFCSTVSKQWKYFIPILSGKPFFYKAL